MIFYKQATQISYSHFLKFTFKIIYDSVEQIPLRFKEKTSQTLGIDIAKLIPTR